MNEDEVKEIFEELLDVLEPCDHWDHHGYCQTHFLHDRDDCPVARMQNILDGWPSG